MINDLNITYFNFSMGSYCGANIEILLKRKVLTYNYSETPIFADAPQFRTLNGQALSELQQLLPLIKKWKKFDDGNVMDGLCWELIIKAGRKIIVKKGNSSFPPEWEQLLDVAGRMCGKNFVSPYFRAASA